MTRTPLLTTKITKDTKVSEILFLNFVLFVSFVVQTVFAYLVAASRAGETFGVPFDRAWGLPQFIEGVNGI
jgi:hypothetical protein